MSPVTLIVLALAVFAAVLLIKRETQTGGLLGLSVEQRAKLLEPIAEYLLRRTFDDDVMGFEGMRGHTATQPARALAAWASWKYGASSGEARAWQTAIAVAREKINAEGEDVIGRIFEGLAAMVGAILATIGGGPAAGAAAWAGYVGSVTVRELEADDLIDEANAFMRETVRELPTIENEFHRFFYCAPLTKLPAATDGLETPHWWDERQPTPENITACARFAFADRAVRR